MIPGSSHSEPEISACMSELPKDKLLILYCWETCASPSQPASFLSMATRCRRELAVNCCAGTAAPAHR